MLLILNYSQTAISGLGNSFLILPPVVPTPENIGAYIAANGPTTTVDSGPYAGTYLPLKMFLMQIV